MHETGKTPRFTRIPHLCATDNYLIFFYLRYRSSVLSQSIFEFERTIHTSGSRLQRETNLNPSSFRSPPVKRCLYRHQSVSSDHVLMFFCPQYNHSRWSTQTSYLLIIQHITIFARSIIHIVRPSYYYAVPYLHETWPARGVSDCGSCELALPCWWVDGTTHQLDPQRHKKPLHSNLWRYRWYPHRCVI